MQKRWRRVPPPSQKDFSPPKNRVSTAKQRFPQARPCPGHRDRRCRDAPDATAAVPPARPPPPPPRGAPPPPRPAPPRGRRHRLPPARGRPAAAAPAPVRGGAAPGRRFPCPAGRAGPGVLSDTVPSRFSPAGLPGGWDGFRERRRQQPLQLGVQLQQSHAVLGGQVLAVPQQPGPGGAGGLGGGGGWGLPALPAGSPGAPALPRCPPERLPRRRRSPPPRRRPPAAAPAAPAAAPAGTAARRGGGTGRAAGAAERNGATPAGTAAAGHGLGGPGEAPGRAAVPGAGAGPAGEPRLGESEREERAAGAVRPGAMTPCGVSAGGCSPPVALGWCGVAVWGGWVPSSPMAPGKRDTGGGNFPGASSGGGCSAGCCAGERGGSASPGPSSEVVFLWRG